MRNYVAKNNFNRSSTHRDRKNDYTRDWDLDEELYYDDRKDLGANSGRSSTNESENSYE